MAFGDRLRHLRERAGMTRDELAAAAGVSRRVLENWEQNRRAPLWASVVLLADTLGVPLDEFRSDDEAAPPRPRGRPRAGE